MSSKLSKMPNIAIPRSRFNQDFDHSTTFMHGKLYPVDCVPVVPGDELKVDMASLIRMSTPIVPIFGNIKMYIGCFFVPSRILLDDFEKFMGDPSNHDKVSTVVPVDPENNELPVWAYTILAPQTNNSYAYEDLLEAVTVRLGKPILQATVDHEANGLKINFMKELGYYQIWNDHFRPSNLIEPCILYKSSPLNSKATIIGTDYNGLNITYYTPVLPVVKGYDYFTACTLSPQFGSSVTLPLGNTAPVFLKNESSSTILGGVDIGIDFAVAAGDKTFDFSLPSTAQKNAKFYADLSSATAATINSIRWAFQVQKYLERSNYGSKYYEILNAHYGVTNPDSRMQRAERLSVHSFYINVNQVLSTAGQDASVNQKVGQVGAVSVTGDKKVLCHYSFDEFGYFYVLAWTKYERSYDGGILREDLYTKRLDFYSPEFANLGDQATKKIELSVYDANNAIRSVKDVFGYQEAWAELRYRRDRISGLLSPSSAQQYVSAGIGGAPTIMQYWTLADNFEGSAVALDKDFLFEDRKALAAALTTGTAGPDYICDFHIKYTKAAELPLYSIPGLIDHFGAL